MSMMSPRSPGDSLIQGFQTGMELRTRNANIAKNEAIARRAQFKDQYDALDGMMGVRAKYWTALENYRPGEQKATDIWKMGKSMFGEAWDIPEQTHQQIYRAGKPGTRVDHEKYFKNQGAYEFQNASKGFRKWQSSLTEDQYMSPQGFQVIMQQAEEYLGDYSLPDSYRDMLMNDLISTRDVYGRQRTEASTIHGQNERLVNAQKKNFRYKLNEVFGGATNDFGAMLGIPDVVAEDPEAPAIKHDIWMEAGRRMESGMSAEQTWASLIEHYEGMPRIQNYLANWYEGKEKGESPLYPPRAQGRYQPRGILRPEGAPSTQIPPLIQGVQGQADALDQVDATMGTRPELNASPADTLSASPQVFAPQDTTGAVNMEQIMGTSSLGQDQYEKVQKPDGSIGWRMIPPQVEQGFPGMMPGGNQGMAPAASPVDSLFQGFQQGQAQEALQQSGNNYVAPKTRKDYTEQEWEDAATVITTQGRKGRELVRYPDGTSHWRKTRRVR